MKETAQKYKRQTASRYLPVGAQEITSKIMEAESYGVSTKHDGHFYLLSYDGKKATLTNHGGRVIDDLPLLKKPLRYLKANAKLLCWQENYICTKKAGVPVLLI